MDYQVMPPLSADEFSALKADIKARGVQVPIEYDESGNVLDGHHRIKAVEQLKAEGVEVRPPPRIIRPGLSEPEKRAHARTLNLARRHLDQAQKRAAIAAQIKDTPERSDRQIAAGLGVAPNTVGAARRELEDGAQIAHHATVVGKDGVTQPRAKPKPVFVSTEAVEKAEALPEKQRTAILSGNSVPPVTIATLHTGDEDSYTPPEYIESARIVMGGIDTDPASNQKAQAIIQARRYFTAEIDGLLQPWSGRVWMNPPYTARVINRFIAKLLADIASGDVSQAIVLTNNNTDTSWFHAAAEVSAAVCFTRGRINFIKPDDSRSSPTNGQSFFYFGSNLAGFTTEFAKYGLVMVKT